MTGEEFGEVRFGEREEDCGVESDGETVPFSFSNKRIKETPIDRLSALPDSVLVHILSSLLSVEAAGRTSVLSKRWRFLWAELPDLRFFESGYKHEIEKTSNFVSMISRTLDVRSKRNHLEVFTVSFKYHECFDSDVDAWVEFCVKNEVKHLGLIMLSYCCDDYYTPSQMMYSYSSLTSLHLSRCFMTSERKIEWQSLTRLSLEDVELNQLLIDEIVTSCPLLHYLMLERCCGFDRLEVNSRYLNCLRVEQSSYEPYLEISAPYIRDLDITVHLEGSKCRLKNISSVVEASIDFSDYAYNCSVEMMSNAKEFLESFKHVKELRVWQQAFEILSVMDVNDWQLPQSMLQKLELTSCSVYKHAISGIIGMLKSSPNLETLLLDGYEQEEEIVNLDPAAKSDLDCDLLHLKTITVNNLSDSNGEPLLTLARILLRRTPVLEEMRIAIDVEDKNDFVNIAQKLLSYPRSSTKAEIHLFSRK